MTFRQHRLRVVLQCACSHVPLVAGALLLGSCGSPAAPTPAPPPVSPPSISCPASQQLVARSGRPIVVEFGAPTVIGGTTPVTLGCTPVSGSTFPIGSTTVTCKATDAVQRISSCSMVVEVTLPPQVALTTFAAFGDSITRGEDGTNAITTSAFGRLLFHNDVVLNGLDYPSVLQSALKNRYSTQSCLIGVGNLGQPGEALRDSSALQRFSSRVLTGAYQSVLIMEGSNDTYQAYYSGSQILQDALNSLQTMIRRAKAVNVRPLVATIPPQNRNACVPICRGYGQDFVAAFNEQIRTLARAEGITLVDVYQAFNNDLSLLSSDGLHPNANGFQRIADAFADAIKASTEVPPTGITACSSPAALSPLSLRR